MSSDKIDSIRDGDNRYRVVRDGATLGHVTVWYQRHRVNSTGVKRFRSKPLGAAPPHDCDTYSSAIAYMVGYVDG